MFLLDLIFFVLNGMFQFSYNMWKYEYFSYEDSYEISFENKIAKHDKIINEYYILTISIILVGIPLLFYLYFYPFI